MGGQRSTVSRRMRAMASVSAVALIGSLFALVALDVQPAAAATCASANIGVTNLTGSTFWMDSGQGNKPILKGNYEGFKITNSTGAALNGAWVKIDTFTGTGNIISLAPTEDGVDQLNDLANGSSDVSYFYLQASGVTTSIQTHTVRVYDRRPDLSGATELCNTTTSFSEVADRGVDSANKVNVVTETSNPPGIGAIVTMTVTGETGTIGSQNLFNMQPATVVSPNNNLQAWPANVFELVSAKVNIDLDGTGASDHADFLTWTFTDPSSANRSYIITYKFRVIGTTSANVTVTPVQFIASGTLIKHSDVGSGCVTSISSCAVQPILPPTSATTISKSASVSKVATQFSTDVTYSVTATNSGSTARTVTGSITNNSATVTAASGTFTSADVGRSISGTGIPTGANIITFTSSTQVTISQNATVTNASASLTIGTNQDVSIDQFVDGLPTNVSYLGTPLFNGSSISAPTTSAGRTFSDAVLNATTTMTSATANFTASDLGRQVTGTGIPANTAIRSINSTTSASCRAPRLRPRQASP